MKVPDKVVDEACSLLRHGNDFGITVHLIATKYHYHHSDLIAEIRDRKRIADNYRKPLYLN